jgi:hypothetical protein
MNCTGCHHAGTVGFRALKKPVDWQTIPNPKSMMVLLFDLKSVP